MVGRFFGFFFIILLLYSLGYNISSPRFEMKISFELPLSRLCEGVGEKIIKTMSAGTESWKALKICIVGL